MPLSLSDSELTALLDAARPVPRHARDAFLQAVAVELEKYPEIGVGVIHRITARLQREHISPPTMAGRFAKHGR